MQLRVEQLHAHLTQTLAPLYCVQGNEILLVQEAADAVRQAAKERGCSQRDLYLIDNHFNWRTLTDSSLTSSLFAEQRLIELRIPSGKPGTEGANTLQEWCKQPPPDTVTLILLPKPERATRNAKWFTALTNAAVTLEIASMTREHLPRWIAERLARQQQQADRAALQWMTDKTEGNLLATQQEILKLGLLYPTGKLTLEQIQSALLNVARYDLFQLTDALLEKQLTRAIHILRSLREEGEASTLILWGITRELRQLHQLADTPTAQRRQAMFALGIRDKRQTVVEQALRRLRTDQLTTALHMAARIDRCIKGLENDDPWLMMEQLIITLCADLTTP